MNVAKQTANFKCLRCGHAYEDDYSPSEVRERACPRCASNSVRRVRTAPSATKG